jgi:hypothetical protein
MGVALAVLLLCPLPPTRGDFVTSLTVETIAALGGLTKYEYTLKNDTSSDLSAFHFSLDVAADANLFSPYGPDDWYIGYSPGDNQIIWTSFDPATDLPPGGTILFGFFSPLSPSIQNYLIAGISDSPPDLETNTGQIASPGVSAVPEPGSLALSVTGALGMLAYTLYRERKSRR